MKKLLFTLPALAVALVVGNLEAQIRNYSEWAAKHLADYPDETALWADPGDFGVSNFVRYAFALNPWAATKSPMQQIHAAEGDLISFSFHRYEGIVDVKYTIEVTDNLGTDLWTSIPLEELEPVISTLGDGREQVVIARSQEGVNRRFYRIRADLVGTESTVIFYEDFESYWPSETPYRGWVTSIPTSTQIYVDGEAGSRYLTMTDTSTTAVARLMRSFDMEEAQSVSATYEWNRMTDAAYENHLGDGLRVPALHILRDVANPPLMFSSNIVIQIVFANDNQAEVWYRTSTDDLVSTKLTSNDFDHDDPIKVRMTYHKAGQLKIEVSKDDFETVEWSLSEACLPNMNLNTVAVSSSNRNSHPTVSYADPVWELRSVLLTAEN